MGRRERLRSGLVAVALVAFAIACEGEAERTFYNDLDATNGTVPGDGMQGGGDSAEDGGPTTDATGDGTSGLTGDAAREGSDDGETRADAGSDAATEAGRDAAGGVDAAPEAEAGCGPLDTATNCGACGTTCDSTHSHGAGCNGSACTYSGCDPGYGDCIASPPNTNGCETPITTTSNCTGCGIACDTANSVGAGCNGTTCTYTGCKSGFANCIATAPDNGGCETPTDTTSNCGACGVACGSFHTTGATCSGTTCAYSCAANWINCNMKAPNTTGCECNTPSCCADAGASSCQTTHATGFPSLNYYDCNPIATSSESQAKLLTQAIEACTAYTGAVSQCATGLTCAGHPGVGPYVCDGMGGTNCATCWAYGGTDVLQTENCSCPPDTTTIGTWN